MKIIDVCAFYTVYGGGVKTYVDQKLKFAAEAGHEMVIIAPGTDDRIEERDGGRIHFLAAPALPMDRRYNYFDQPDRVHALLDRESPDVVEASSPWRTASIVANWRGEARRSLIMHADPLAAYAYRWFGAVADRATIDRQFQWFWNHLRRVSARCDIVVSANDSLTRRLRAGGISNVQTIGMGIDPGIFSPLHRDESLRADLLSRCGLAPDATLLLGVGRFSPEKRWPMVIDAVMRAGHHHQLGMILIGHGRAQRKLHDRIGRSPHVHLLQPTSDRHLLATLMASADMFIHGCEAETFGLVAAEAAASGLPLIVPEDGGASEFATLATAELYQSASRPSAADAIDRMVKRDRLSVRNAAFRQALTVPSIHQHFSSLIEAYVNLPAGRKIAA